MNVFDNKWIGVIHCLIWKLEEIDQWELHGLIYDLYRENLLEVNHWSWMGESPRSPEIDGALALLNMVGAIEIDGDRVKAKKPPLISCDEHEVIGPIIKTALRKAPDRRVEAR